MNNERRRKIKQAKELLDKANDLINDVINDEDMAFNNLSEGLQQTMRGEQMEENVSEMEEAIDGLEEVIQHLDNLQ